MAIKLVMLWLVLLLFVSTTTTGVWSQQFSETTSNKDAVEGETIRLDCRFNPQLLGNNPNKLIFYWHRTNNKKTDPVAINENPLDTDYSIEHNTIEGKYDLLIQRAQYDRDNGQFECKIKEAGNGAEIKSLSYVVTILIPPGPPLITPLNPVAKEGEPFELTCSSQGGSPDPLIQWYRDNIPLDGQISKGGTRDKPTSNTLTIEPTLELDHAIYKCTVWNRATREDKKLESVVSLTVHYKPRVTVGPFNPLSVSIDGNAEMTCNVVSNPPARSIRWMKNGQLLTNTNNHTIIRVKPDDSGKYDCIADNGIGGTPGKESLELAVLHGPKVNVVPEREAVTNDVLNVKCNIASNPKPHTVIWQKEDDPYFKQVGTVLVLNQIRAEDSGNYMCIATTNLKPSGALEGVEKSDNATVKIRVKHKPGETEIFPMNPIAVAGKPFTLTCQSKPPGYPEPEYKWWREGQEQQELGRRINYTFIAVHVSQEGRYFCEPFNALGKGSVGSVYLSVNEPPTMVISMKPQFIAKEGDKNFKLTCIARGKPKPNVVWFQNDQEINVDSGQFRVEKREQIEDANVHNIQTTLHFEAMSRKGTNSISASDRGRYTCLFDNGIGKSAKSETVLRVEHSPVVRHSYNRVAYDYSETAVLQCKMSAYPAPKFEWFFRGKILDNYSDRYNTNSSEQGDDIHVGTLSIRNTKENDYGDYTCRAFNSVGDDDEKTIIKLVKKSAPEMPMQLEMVEVLSDSVILRWIEGFNGGFSNTEYVVTYNDGERWRNESCRSLNPCKITGLESRHEYQFRVLAVNPRGYSPYSEDLKVTTKVNLKDMPNAFDSFYDREKNTLVFNVEPHDVPLKLVAKIEVRNENNGEWRQLTTVQIISNSENVYLKSTPEEITDIRVILCLQSNDSWCGYEHLVKMDSIYARETKSLTTDHLLGVILIASVSALAVVTSILCCCWKRKDKTSKKDYESDSSTGRPKVTTISQPFYASHDNKGLMSDVDNSNKLNPPLYSSTNGSLNGHISQNYYLTGEGGDPSPSGSTETGQSELWTMIKSDMMHENPNDNPMSYHSGYGSTHMQMDPNGYLGTYAYYPHEGYQPLNEDTLNMNRKNNMHVPYYDDLTANPYGTALGMGMEMIDPLSGDPNLMPAMDPSKMNHIPYDEELEYSSNRNGRVIREIIV
jgi:echinoid protein